jgi:flagellar protein FliS
MEGISAYKQNAVLTATPGRLIVMLYDGAIRFLRKAIDEIEAKRWTEKGQSINKALDILNELKLSLHAEADSEIAQNLLQLYEFMIRHLHRANIQRDPQRLREVIQLLEELNAGWKAVAK